MHSFQVLFFMLVKHTASSQEAASVELLQTHFVLYYTTDLEKEQVKHRCHTALDHLSIKL